MPSRWAFEALAVSHFVDNDYESNYFNIDKIDSDISYKLNFLIPKLNSLLDEWRTIDMTSKDSQRIKELSEIISNTMINSLRDIPDTEARIIGIENLAINQQINKYQNFIDFAKLFYSEYIDRILYKKDLITSNIVKQFKNPEQFINFRNAHFNESIANMVLKNDDSEKLFIRENKIIRRFEPVFMTPTNSYGRTHFYSAIKKVGNNHFSTVYFNVIVIWIISLILYISLVFDFVKRIKVNSFNFITKLPKIKLFHKV